ncbi:MAG TPA: hypothetical protein VLW51_08360 [Solirubrobacteraceae bacterium]|nr:hypothetical protein [Solirubrobacteraceae bacterium]
MLSDILPTGYHRACTAGVMSGSTVHVAGAGPVGPAAAHSATGRCAVMKYHHGLMQMILNDKAQIAKAVDATVITLDEAPKGHKDFDHGAAKKFVLNPHGPIKARRTPTPCKSRQTSPRARPSGHISMVTMLMCPGRLPDGRFATF